MGQPSCVKGCAISFTALALRQRPARASFPSCPILPPPPFPWPSPVIAALGRKVLNSLGVDVVVEGGESNGVGPGVGVDHSTLWVDVITASLRLTTEVCTTVDPGVCVPFDGLGDIRGAQCLCPLGLCSRRGLRPYPVAHLHPYPHPHPPPPPPPPTAWTDAGFVLLQLLGLYCPPVPALDGGGVMEEGADSTVPGPTLLRRQLPPVLQCPFGPQLLHAVFAVTTNCPYVFLSLAAHCLAPPCTCRGLAPLRTARCFAPVPSSHPRLGISRPFSAWGLRVQPNHHALIVA